MRSFKQLQGTVTESKFALPYTILFMDHLEDKILNSFVEKPQVWWQYIDDIFMIWQHRKEKIKKFLKALNNSQPTIKFTAEYSLDKANFLDLEVIRCGKNSLQTYLSKLRILRMQTYQYLKLSSCYVYHSQKFVPYSQALRFNRICSENKFFDN